MKKKLLAALLAAAMLTGLASATFAASSVVDSNKVELTVTNKEITVEVGGAGVQISASATGTDMTGDEDTNLPVDPITYVSNDTTKATVSTTGLVTGVAAGTTTITVTAKAGKATTTETVTVTVTGGNTENPATVRAVGIAPSGAPTWAVGTSATLTATVTMSDGSDYTGTKTWTVSPEGKGVTVVDGTVTIAEDAVVGTEVTVTLAVEGSDLTGTVTFIVKAASSGDNNNTNNGGSTSTGGGSSSSGSTTTTTPAEETVSTTEAVAKVEQAIAAADENVTVVVVKVRNAKSITAAALKAVAKAAEKAEKTPVIHADVVKDGKVESRLYIDPSLVKGNDEIKLGVTLGDEKVEAKFAGFKKDMAIVKFDQVGSFGMNIKAAVKLDLSKLNTKTLIFYNYNPKTNRFSKMSVKDYRIDANNYLHFTTSVGNYVLVTDEPLKK